MAIVTSPPQTTGGMIAVVTSTDLSSLSTDGLTIGTLVWNEQTSSYFALTISTASLTSKVLAVTGVAGVRWIEQNIVTSVGGVLPIANGGTGQTTANAAINALQVMTSGQNDTVLISGVFNNQAPDLLIQQIKSSNTTSAGIGITNATEIQNGSGILKRAMTNATTLSTVTNGAEVALHTVSVIVGGTLTTLGGFEFQGGNATIPGVWVGNTGTGMRRNGATNLGLTVGLQEGITLTGALVNLNHRTNMNAIRFSFARGASIAVATTITLGADGNVFPLTAGTGTLNSIVATNWQAGSRIVLECASGITITNNTAGTGATILTNTGASIVTAFTRCIPLTYNGTNWIVEG